MVNEKTDYFYHSFQRNAPVSLIMTYIHLHGYVCTLILSLRYNYNEANEIKKITNIMLTISIVRTEILNFLII